MSKKIQLCTRIRRQDYVKILILCKEMDMNLSEMAREAIQYFIKSEYEKLMKGGKT